MIQAMFRDSETNTIVLALGVTPAEVAEMVAEGSFTVLEADLRDAPPGLGFPGLVEQVRIHVFAGADDDELRERMMQLGGRMQGVRGCGECEGCQHNTEQAAQRVVEIAEHVARAAAPQQE